ncbi:MAG: TolC family protein [Spirochaetaceae bacterium]|jgi:outer membrane protein TolC|nr:TolC family protein [Spirochaetaceae bacterium]
MKFIRVCVMLCLFGNSLFAQELRITLDEALEQGLEESLRLKQAQIDLDLASGSARNLWAQVFPGISVSGGLAYQNSLSAAGPQDPLRYTAAVDVSLSLTNSLFLSMKNISLAYHRELLSYEQARRQLENTITKTFFQLLAKQSGLSILKENLDLAEAQREKQEIAFRNGLVSELVRLESQLGAGQAALALSRARTEFNSELGKFLALLGYDQSAGAVLEGELSVQEFHPDGEALIRDYLQKRPDIVLQRQNIAVLENTRHISAIERRGPILNLGAEWSGAYGDSVTNGFPSSFSDGLTGRLILRIPLDSWLPGSKGDQSIRSAGGELEKARLELESMERNGMAEIRSYADSINDSWESIAIARLRSEIAMRAYELAEEGYRSGTVEFLDLQDTRQDMVNARQELLAAELSYQTLVLDLAALINITWKELHPGER